MPDNNNNNNNGENAGDGAAAKTAEEIKAEEAAAAANGEGDGSGDGTGDGSGDGEETITMKKSDLKKIEEDRDNYKAGLLGKKADDRNLKSKTPEEIAAAEAAAEAGGEGSTVIDEKKVAEAATIATNKALYDASERSAKRAFLKAHSEYLNDADWTALMSHLTFRGSEVTHDEITDRMEAALLEHKRSTGKLEEHLKAEHELGIKEGRIQADIESGAGTGGSDDGAGSGKGAGKLSPKAEEMAKRMHTDPEKVKKVDTSKDNVIDVTK